MSERTVVNIDGVALKQVPEEADNWLPDIEGTTHYPPYSHQVKMQDIISSTDKGVLMNTTVTGGGKTFSYAVPTIRQNLFSVVIFPTNALTADQYRSISELATEYFPNKDTYVRQLTADRMQQRRENLQGESGVSTDSLKNSQQIQRALDEANRNSGPSFILTNPDVFLGILRGKYDPVTRQKLEVADMAIVDEFHHASPKGKNSLIMSMDELYHRSEERCNLKKFIFLSATPDTAVEKQLSEHFGRPDDTEIYYRIDSSVDSKQISELSLSDDEPYNPVMPQVRMTCISSRPFRTKDKIHSDEYKDRIVEFVSSGRSIVIVDGVAEVNDVYKMLQRETDDSIQVSPISGLRSDDISRKLNESDVIVGNSTLEMGVDIGDVENIVFSGYSQSRFMQRLGRLRASSNNFRKSAVCFTTPNTIRALDSLNDLSKSQASRDVLEGIIEQHLGGNNDSEFFRSEFSPIEMYRAIDNRAETMFESEENYRQYAARIVAKHCFKSSDIDIRNEDIERMWQMADSEIGKSLQSYRQSALSALVYDQRTDSVKTYPITSILRLANAEFLTEPEFDQRLREHSRDPELYESEKAYVQSYVWMSGQKIKDKLRNPQIVASNQIRDILSKEPINRKPEVINSIEFTVDNADGLSGINNLNRQLDLFIGQDTDQSVIGYPTEGHPAEVQAVYGLDEFFFTNPITNLNGEYTLALGENALYLYGHVQENLRSAKRIHDKYSN